MLHVIIISAIKNKVEHNIIKQTFIMVLHKLKSFFEIKISPKTEITMICKNLTPYTLPEKKSNNRQKF